MTDRWSTYVSEPIEVSSGCRLDTVVEPARLGGANGIVWSPDGRLMVTQVFGSQVTAIDVNSGDHLPYAALGEGIAAPDDGAFGADGTFFATEPMNSTVSARQFDGSYRTLRDDLPAVNGMTVSHDGRRLFVDEFRPGGRLLELDPTGEKPPTVLADDLAMPNALAMGPDGALWFPQVLAGEIWRYDLERRNLERKFSDLSTPTAVKFDRDGHLLTSEGGTGHLTRIEVATGSRETLASVNPGIDNFAIADDGRLFVSHFTDGRVSEVTGGTERVLSPSGLIGPFGLDRLADHSLLTADALAVNQIGPGGEARVIMSLLADLPAMAIDVANHDGDPLVLLGRGQVLRRRPDGRLESVAGHLDDATSITTAGGQGAVVVERGSGRLLMLDGEGKTDVALDGLDRPVAVAIGPDGTFWVSRAGGITGVRNAEQVASIDGLADPHGIALTGGTVVVAEPSRRTLVGIDLAMQERRDLVTNLPLGPAVTGARTPHSFSPLLSDGDGVLVGCDGDGSVRRLTLTS